MQIGAVIGAWWALLQVLICLRLLPGQLFALNHHAITHKDLPLSFSGCLFSSWGHGQAHPGQLQWPSAATLLCILWGHTEQRQGGGCNGLSPLTDCAGIFLDPLIRHSFDWWELAFSCSVSKWLFEVAPCCSPQWLLWVFHCSEPGEQWLPEHCRRKPEREKRTARVAPYCKHGQGESHYKYLQDVL